MVANHRSRMEILSPTFVQTALDIAIVLGLLCLAQIAIIIAVRWRADYDQRLTAEFRRRTAPEVTAYLKSRSGLRLVVEALQRDPTRALDLLMEMSASLEPDERLPLRSLFATLPLRSRELEALKSRQWSRRLLAAERLGYLGDGVAVPALLDALHDPVLDVRFAAARSLAAHGETRAIPVAILAFDLPGNMNHRRVTETLGCFGPEAIEPLLEVLANREILYSINSINVAIRTLGLLRARAAVEPLTKLLEHSEFRVRLNAVRSLGFIGDASVAPAVARLAGDPAWEVRNTVMQTLGKLGATDHRSVLADALRDESWWVRFSAAEALWQLGQPGRQALTAALTHSADRFARDISRQILQEHGALETPTTSTT